MRMRILHIAILLVMISSLQGALIELNNISYACVRALALRKDISESDKKILSALSIDLKEKVKPQVRKLSQNVMGYLYRTYTSFRDGIDANTSLDVVIEAGVSYFYIFVDKIARETMAKGQKCRGKKILDDYNQMILDYYTKHGRILTESKIKSEPNFSLESLRRKDWCSAFDYRRLSQVGTLTQDEKMCADNDSKGDSQRMTVCLKDSLTNKGSVDCLERILVLPIKICMKYGSSQKKRVCESEKTVYPSYTCRGDLFEYQGKEYCTDKELVPVVAYCSQKQNREGLPSCNQEEYFFGLQDFKIKCTDDGVTTQCYH